MLSSFQQALVEASLKRNLAVLESELGKDAASLAAFFLHKDAASPDAFLLHEEYGPAPASISGEVTSGKAPLSAQEILHLRSEREPAGI